MTVELSASTLSETERSALRRPGTRLPLVLVVLALALAILLPRFAQMRIARFRNEINQAAEPARQRLLEIQLDLAIEASSQRGYLLTGKQSELAMLSRFRSHRVGAEQQLIANAKQLDATGENDFAPIAERLRELDAQLDSTMSLATPGRATETVLAEQLRQGLLIRAVADSLNVAIERAAEERRISIGNIENGDQLLTAVLLLLGAVATFMVARLGTTFRTLALRLDESEARLRQVAESRQRLVRGFTHDVKNPLGAADGYLALLEEGVMGPLERSNGEQGVGDVYGEGYGEYAAFLTAACLKYCDLRNPDVVITLASGAFAGSSIGEPLAAKYPSLVLPIAI